jgi:hypothetical protein
MSAAERVFGYLRKTATDGIIFGNDDELPRLLRHEPVVLHLTPYFYNWPVRIWPICRPEGDVGTYSPWCRGQWSYNIPSMAAVQSLVCVCVGGGGVGQTELQLQAQTHRKSMSWNVPEVGLAHDPRRGN